MAQVTMTGMEYAELLRKSERLEELLNHLCKATQVRFPKDSIRTYSCGVFPEYTPLPQWAEEARINYMAGWLCDLPEDEFTRWVEAGARYLDRRDMTLNQNSYGRYAVDLWEHPKLKKVVGIVQENLAKEKEENNG